MANKWIVCFCKKVDVCIYLFFAKNCLFVT